MDLLKNPKNTIWKEDSCNILSATAHTLLNYNDNVQLLPTDRAESIPLVFSSLQGSGTIIHNLNNDHEYYEDAQYPALFGQSLLKAS